MSLGRSGRRAVGSSCGALPRLLILWRRSAAKWCGCDGSRNFPKGKWRGGWASQKGLWRVTSREAFAYSPTMCMAPSRASEHKSEFRSTRSNQVMGSGNSQQIEEAAAAWLARRDSGDWSDAEQAAFGLWVEQSTAHRVAFVRLESAWHQAQRLKALAAGATPGTVPPLGEWRQSPFFERQVANGSTDATDETAAANFSVDAGPARSSTTDIKPVDVPISRSTNLIPLATRPDLPDGRRWSRIRSATRWVESDAEHCQRNPCGPNRDCAPCVT